MPPGSVPGTTSWCGSRTVRRRRGGRRAPSLSGTAGEEVATRSQQRRRVPPSSSAGCRQRSPTPGWPRHPPPLPQNQRPDEDQQQHRGSVWNTARPEERQDIGRVAAAAAGASPRKGRRRALGTLRLGAVAHGRACKRRDAARNRSPLRQAGPQDADAGPMHPADPNPPHGDERPAIFPAGFRRTRDTVHPRWSQGDLLRGQVPTTAAPSRFSAFRWTGPVGPVAHRHSPRPRRRHRSRGDGAVGATAMGATISRWCFTSPAWLAASRRRSTGDHGLRSSVVLGLGLRPKPSCAVSTGTGGRRGR